MTQVSKVCLSLPNSWKNTFFSGKKYNPFKCSFGHLECSFDDNSCFLKRSLIQIVLTDTFKAILMTLLVNFWRASRKKHTFGLKKLSRKLKKFFIKVWHFPKVYIFPENDLLETLKVALTTHRIFFRKRGKKSSIIVPERHKAVFSQNLLTQTVSLDT